MAVAYETEVPFAPRAGLGPYRDADYAALPDQPRCELLFGRLQMTPAPSLRHQEIVLRLGRLLLDYADGGAGRAFCSPLDVALAPHSVVQPDLVFVAAERAGILGTRVEGAPDLVVEVLSASTARMDVGEKLRLYAAAGVAEYWIVDPERREFQFLVLHDGAYSVRLAEAGVYASPTLAGLAVDVAAFWRQIPD